MVRALETGSISRALPAADVAVGSGVDGMERETERVVTILKQGIEAGLG